MCYLKSNVRNFCLDDLDGGLIVQPSSDALMLGVIGGLVSSDESSEVS